MAAKKRRKRKYYSKTKSSQSLFARRGLTVAFLLLLSAAILFGLYQLVSLTGSFLFSRNPHFSLKTIDLTTDGRLSVSELRRWADIDGEDNLFAFDFDYIRANLLSKPQVESVSIQRRLPSTLAVRVVERDGIVQIRFRRSGFLYLLDRHGIAMRPPPTRSTKQSLPLIEGLKIAEPRLGEKVTDSGVQYVLELLSQADALGLGTQLRFKKFDLHYADFITAHLDDGVSARFPRHSAREKLIRFVRVLQTARDQGRGIVTVDLTPDGLNVPTIFE